MNFQGTRQIKAETCILGKPLAFLPALQKPLGYLPEAIRAKHLDWVILKGFPSPRI